MLKLILMILVALVPLTMRAADTQKSVAIAETDAYKLKYLDAQAKLEASELQRQRDVFQKQLDDLAVQLKATQESYTKAFTDVCKRLNVDSTKYIFDGEKLVEKPLAKPPEKK